MANDGTRGPRRISLIAAVAENGVIGSGGTIPWNVPGEQKMFKRITLGHTVIMGRKTWESIGRPLPERTNIVVSRRPGYRLPGCVTAQSLAGALKQCPPGESEAFIIGGGQLYREAMPIADRIYISWIPLRLEGDTYFPPIVADEFSVTSREHCAGPPVYDLLVYDRIRR
jgi:dihydrofolate reductase